MPRPTREEVLAIIKQIDEDIADEATAHKHYKELAEQMREIDEIESSTQYEIMSIQEGEHLQRLMQVRVMFINRYM